MAIVKGTYYLALCPRDDLVRWYVLMSHLHRSLEVVAGFSSPSPVTPVDIRPAVCKFSEGWSDFVTKTGHFVAVTSSLCSCTVTATMTPLLPTNWNSLPPQVQEAYRKHYQADQPAIKKQEEEDEEKKYGRNWHLLPADVQESYRRQYQDPSNPPVALSVDQMRIRIHAKQRGDNSHILQAQQKAS